MNELEPLFVALRELRPSGERGFEGMLRDAVSDVIGQELRLMKSGAQHGADMGTESNQAEPVISVEAKRYGQDTNLPLDHLKAKLVDAVHNNPALDLYVFGATREISRGDQEELIKLGGREGVGIIFIDWPSSACELPPLAVLCALVPGTVLNRVQDNNGDIERTLIEVRNCKAFEKARGRLIKRLIRPDMGWNSARCAVGVWLRKAFKNRNFAWGHLGSLVNISDPNVHLVSRPRISEKLDEWWGELTAPIVLLGEEGNGKTWALLSWWNRKAGQESQGLPLTLFFSAKEVSNVHLEGLVAVKLARQTGIRDERFWQRRVKLWLESPDRSLRFLLIFDGLNENFLFQDWSRVTAQLQSEPWAGKVAVALTCRPDYWLNELHQLVEVEPTPITQNVGPFDDRELDELLSFEDLSRDDFAQDLLSLLRVPRLCELAIRHRTAMAESGDVTRERLIYEDWKDRLGRRGGRVNLSDGQFRQFIAKMGRELHQSLKGDAEAVVSLTRRELSTQLGEESGRGIENLSQAISEIVDGRWFDTVPGDPDRFRLNKQLMPFVLGMALVAALRKAPQEGLSNSLAEFMEPLGEQPLAVELLRSAVSIAVLDQNISAPVSSILIAAWLQRQNFTQSDFEAFWRLVPADVGLFLDVAESIWLDRHGGHHSDEVFIKGLANSAERWTTVRNTVLNWAQEWLGTYWGDPMEGMVLNYDPNGPEVAQRIEQTRSRRMQWDQISDYADDGIPIREHEDGQKVAWLTCRVLGILSFVPSSILVSAITAWAVSRSIMNRWPQHDQVAWLMRLPSQEDLGDFNSAISERAQRLIRFGVPVATEAARLMLTAHATIESSELAANIGVSDETTRPKIHFTVTVSECGERLVWDRGSVEKHETGENPPLAGARELASYATNPQLQLSSQDADILKEWADATDESSLWRSMAKSSGVLALENAEAALARWAPEALGRLARRVFLGATSSEAGNLDQIGYQVPGHLLLLTEKERGALAQIALSSRFDDQLEEPARVCFFLAALAEKSASEQIDEFLKQPSGPRFDRNHSSVLSEPTVSDFLLISKLLEGELTTAQIQGWLWYLSCVPLDAMPSGFPCLVPLIDHPDPLVRELVLQIIYLSGDPKLLSELKSSSWAITDDMGRAEMIYGSIAIAKAIQEPFLAEDLDRIDTKALNILLHDGECSEEVLEAYSNVVSGHIEKDFGRERLSRMVHQHHFAHARAIDSLVVYRGNEVVRWIAPLLSNPKKATFRYFIEDFPYIDICRGLLRHRPKDGAEMWQSLWAQHERSPYSSDSFLLLPFESPDSEEVFHLREFVVDRAATDEKFGRIAANIILHGHHDWLLDCIRRHLDEESAGGVARGVWLAGLLDSTDEALELWRRDLVESPASGWLSTVYERARATFQRNQWAHHWLNEFLRERDRDRAFGQHTLFLRCVDRRVLAWTRELLDECWNELPDAWQVHWSLRSPRLVEAVQERDKEWKKTLFGTRITTHIQRPWH